MELHDAAEAGDIDRLRGLLNRDRVINIQAMRAPDSNSPLHTACIAGHVAAVQCLLDAGADIDRVNTKKLTPLSVAVKGGQLDVVRVLLEAGAAVTRKQPNSQPTFGHKSAIPILLTAVESTADTAVAIVELLVDAGADVNDSMWLGTLRASPLKLAVRSGNPAVVTLLLAAGADANWDGGDAQSPLILCVKRPAGDEVLAALLDGGADPNAVAGPEGETPLFLAASRKCSHVRALLAAGADPNAACEGGRRPLHAAVQYGTTETVEALVAAGADVNALNGTATTPLTLACRLDNFPAVKLLVECGADVDDFGAGSMSPLALSVTRCSYALITYLLTRGADVNAPSDSSGETALIHACSGGPTNIIRMLLHAGADANIGDDDGNTPLIRLCSDYPDDGVTAEQIACLVCAGADVRDINTYGESALTAAAYFNTPTALHALVTVYSVWSCEELTAAWSDAVEEAGDEIDEFGGVLRLLEESAVDVSVGWW